MAEEAQELEITYAGQPVIVEIVPAYERETPSGISVNANIEDSTELEVEIAPAYD